MMFAISWEDSSGKDGALVMFTLNPETIQSFYLRQGCKTLYIIW